MSTPVTKLLMAHKEIFLKGLIKSIIYEQRDNLEEGDYESLCSSLLGDTAEQISNEDPYDFLSDVDPEDGETYEFSGQDIQLVSSKFLCAVLRHFLLDEEKFKSFKFE